MQDIEQNMDDLFRKAADNYPLKVNESQWDDIAPVLFNKPKNSAPVKQTNWKKYTGLLLLFLSLLLADGIITNNFKNDLAPYLIQQAEKNKANPLLISNEAAAFTKNYKPENIPEQKKNYALSKKENLQSTTDINSHTLRKAAIQKNTILSEATINNPNKNSYPAGDATLQKNPLAEIFPVTTYSIASTIIHESPVEKDKVLAKNDNIVKKVKPAILEKNIEIKDIQHQLGIYLGVVSGPLFDEVKNQGLKKTGFSAGIIAGYQLKKHLSVETGLLFAKKPYFSTGKYFSMDKISNSMPPGMQILSLEGNNFVWELPVRMKYNFLHKDKHNFFSSAGITSYIMTDEKNNYLVSMNGTQQTMISSYKNKSRSLAATLDISAGYEHKLGKSNYFRVEPYVQIPLKGMGVGSMPMISSGLRIGITKFTN